MIVQNEIYYVNENLTIKIEIHSTEGFSIKYYNEKNKKEKFSIFMDVELLISLLKEFETKSKIIFLKEELNIKKVYFDFFRFNTLYFDINFENIVNKESFQVRMNVFHKTNNYGSIGDIYALNLIRN